MLDLHHCHHFSLYVFFCEHFIVISTAWSKPCIPQLTRKKTSATMHEASPKVAPTAKVATRAHTPSCRKDLMSWINSTFARNLSQTASIFSVCSRLREVRV